MHGRSEFKPFSQSLSLQMLACCGVSLVCLWYRIYKELYLELTGDLSFTSKDWFEISYIDLISFEGLDRIFLLFCIMTCFDEKEASV